MLLVWHGFALILLCMKSVAKINGNFAGAQCAATCVKNYGGMEAATPTNRYHGSSCTSSFCRACLLPCQTRPVGFQRCSTLCASWLESDTKTWRVCIRSCRRFYSSLEQRGEKQLPEPQRLRKLEMVCAEGNNKEVQVLLRWILKSNDSAMPIAFVIGVYESLEKPWVLSSFSLLGEAVVSGLLPSLLSKYQFHVTGVNDKGEMDTSKTVTFHFENDLALSNFEVTYDNHLTIIRWESNMKVCRFRLALIIMSAHEGRRVQWRTVSGNIVKFSGLVFGADYLLRVYPIWPNASSYIFRFRMLECETDCFLTTEAPILTSRGHELRILMKHKANILSIEGSRQGITDGIETEHPKLNKSVILGVLVPVGLVFGLLAFLAAYRLIHNKFSVRAAFSLKPQLHDDHGRPDPFETSFTRLEFEEEMGRGEFGVVYRGKWSPSNRVAKIDVAVKKLQPKISGCNEVRQFLDEILLMKRIGRHRNVVSLLGCCTRPAFPMCLIMDLCQLGSVRDNLLQMKPRPGDTKQSHCLLRIAYDVSCGMEYLSQLNFVHRDLACRNVLLTAGWVAKIADFGLSRDVYKTSVYRCESGQRLPFRWMSPEALYRRVFSTASDVWSFGVLLWEIMTLGALPFPNLKPDEILVALEKGMRLSRPKLADDAIHELMNSCWEFHCEKRPTFRDIREKIEEALNIRHEYVPLGSPQGTASISCGYLQL